MTPELKASCEVVFQEHKASANPIAWNKDVFRGRMSIGLREMAKETLVEKKIIYFPKPAKKTITILNPVVAGAATFEEAVVMAQKKVPAISIERKDKLPAYATTTVPAFIGYVDINPGHLTTNTGKPDMAITREKWYLRPLFFYIVWPLGAAIVSILIAHLLSEWVEMSYRR